MVSVYDIAFSFVHKAITSDMYLDNDMDNFLDRCVRNVNVMLDSGATSETLMCNIANMKHRIITNKTNIYNLIGCREDDNILKSNQFYYHNLLRIIPKPPQAVWDINTGEIVTNREPLFLEMRASITLEQIIEYYCKCFDMKIDKSSINRYKGSVKYMVEKLGVDIVLFMIDTASDIVSSEDLPKPTSPVGIGEYEQLARERYFAKVSENRVSGDDHIVTRRRILPSRDRHKNDEWLFYEEYDNYS